LPASPEPADAVRRLDVVTNPASSTPIDDGVAGSPDALRHVMGHFASSVTVVTARSAGRLHAMTATAVCSVSLTPPMILVCVSRSSRFHAAVLEAGSWAVSILTAGQEPAARHFSRKGRLLDTQFDDISHFRAPISGAPVLTGCLAWLECRTHAAYEGGDHTILLGEVAVASRQAASEPPLTYYQGSYRAGR
jgi:flavin reductase